MSIKHMTLVWEHSKHEGSALLLLLAIADCANEQGEAWPGHKFLAQRIRLSRSSVQYLLPKIIASKELKVIHQGGSGTADTNHYRINIKGQPADTKTKSQGQPADPLGPVQGQSRASDHAQILLEPLEPLEPINTNYPPPPPPTAAAAETVENGWWNLEGLLREGKVNKTRKIEIMALRPAPVVSAYVSFYLYAMTRPKINVPSLFAAKRLIDEPGGFAGDPFDSLANLGPAELAKCFSWLADGGSTYLDGVMPLALAFRGFMPHNSEPTIARAINELGLSALITKPEDVRSVIADSSDGDWLPPAPRELNAWQRLIEKLFSARQQRSVVERLQRCELLSYDGEKMLIVVPTLEEFNWLSNRLGENLSRNNVEFQLKGK